jgi:ferredoxin-fold anticodon binding domain-containing protein
MGVDVGEKEKEAWGKFNTFSASELKKYNKNPLDKKYTDSLTILRETFIA